MLQVAFYKGKNVWSQIVSHDTAETKAVDIGGYVARTK